MGGAIRHQMGASSFSVGQRGGGNLLRVTEGHQNFSQDGDLDSIYNSCDNVMFVYFSHHYREAQLTHPHSPMYRYNLVAQHHGLTHIAQTHFKGKQNNALENNAIFDALISGTNFS